MPPAPCRHIKCGRTKFALLYGWPALKREALRFWASWNWRRPAQQASYGQCISFQPGAPADGVAYYARTGDCRASHRRPGASHSVRPEQTSIEGADMNKEQVKGTLEKAKGSVKQAVGKAVGNERLQSRRRC